MKLFILIDITPFQIFQSNFPEKVFQNHMTPTCIQRLYFEELGTHVWHMMELSNFQLIVCVINKPQDMNIPYRFIYHARMFLQASRVAENSQRITSSMFSLPFRLIVVHNSTPISLKQLGSACPPCSSKQNIRKENEGSNDRQGEVAAITS